MSNSTPTTSHDIRLERVSKIYPNAGKPAVDDVSLTIEDGEFITLLGPSGSGKTTTLSMIAGFTSVTRGRIYLGGQDISRLKPYRRNLGVVFQHYALFPHMTVRQNVAYPLQQRKMSRKEVEQKVNDVLDLVSLTGLADRLPRQLSGGQQQRVALARAVVYEPGALLLDEPLGALDKKLRDSLQRQIARMHKELGMTFIFVTHDQEEALTLSDRIAVFNEGVIEQVGRPTELYDAPETLFVAEFLGESNVFPGRMSPGGVFSGEFFDAEVGVEAARRSGPDAALVVRPERLTVVDARSPGRPGAVAVRAHVTDVRYLGSHNRVGLRFENGSSGSLMQMVDDTNVPTPGSAVTVTWSPQHQSVVRVGGPATVEPPADQADTVALSTASVGAL